MKERLIYQRSIEITNMYADNHHILEHESSDWQNSKEKIDISEIRIGDFEHNS